MQLWLIVWGRWRQAHKFVLTGLLLFYCSTSMAPQYLQDYLNSHCCSAYPLSFTHQIAASQGSLSQKLTCLYFAFGPLWALINLGQHLPAYLWWMSAKKAPVNRACFVLFCFFHKPNAQYNISALCKAGDLHEWLVKLFVIANIFHLVQLTADCWFDKGKAFIIPLTWEDE